MTIGIEPAVNTNDDGTGRAYGADRARGRAPGFVSELAAALRVEALKARRSPAPSLTALACALAPLMGGVFMMIARDPAWARRMGFVAAKAELTAGAADWPTYVDLLIQSVAVGGLFLFGLVVIWIFGREFSDRTVTDLMALPTPREAIVIAKLIVAAIWSAVLAAEVLLLGLGIGSAIGLPGWSTTLAVDAVCRTAVAASLTVLVVVPLALIASAGRGYFAPVGALLLLVFLAQILAAVGWGAYFPWSVPALYSGAGGTDLPPLAMASYLLVVTAGVAGIVLTVAWWRLADQT